MNYDQEIERRAHPENFCTHLPDDPDECMECHVCGAVVKYTFREIAVDELDAQKDYYEVSLKVVE